jgi:hypothetical protein
MPDNITMSPWGGLVICEDGSTAPQQRLQCLTADGAVVPLAANNVDLRKTPHRGFDRDCRKLEYVFRHPGSAVACSQAPLLT